MDFVKFYSAFEQGDSGEFDKMYTRAFRMLCTYLRTNMRADNQDAEDCAQHALVMTLDRIQKGAIREPQKIYSYLLQSAKNRYIRVRYEQRRSNFQEDMEPYAPVEEQVDLLVSQERARALESCIEGLGEQAREFILFWMENPDVHSEAVARFFDISVNNVWTKRHRLLKKLGDCVRKKLNE